MSKMCPFCNYTISNNRYSAVHCKSRNNEGLTKFKNDDDRDKHYYDKCCKDYQSCKHYKILFAKECVKNGN